VAILKGMGFRVGIFVQNCYLTHVNLSEGNDRAISQAYASADLILSISRDTSRYLLEVLGVPAPKLVLLRYSVDRTIFRPHDKAKIITFMPRKMKEHSVRVVSILKDVLPAGWSLVPLDKITERQVAIAMSKSAIFLAFSEFEGLPVPPVEAALSGNVVIGYHGQGGLEYWRRPNFIAIEQGDIQRFVFEVMDTLNMIVSAQLNLEEINVGMRELAEYFSLPTERLMLQAFLRRASQFF